MSWEEDYSEKYPCPCGKGEYEIRSFSDDWERSRTEYGMICSECREIYTYSHAVVYGHHGNEVERGWVLKSILEAEENRKKDLIKKVRGLYYDMWTSKYSNIKVKKQLWGVLTVDGKYYPALETFYRHTKGYSEAELLKYINGFFNIHSLNRIFEVCNVKPDYGYLGMDENEIKTMTRY